MSAMRRVNQLALTKAEKSSVEMPPPTNPSQVFLGESLMRRVRPKKNPKIYAKISFEITHIDGIMNQKRPL